MINHARTLIFNTSAEPASVLDTYVPETFKPISFIGSVAELHSMLTPSGQSRDMRNYYTDQLVTLMHNPDLSKYITTFDTRITYTDLLSKYRETGSWPGYNVMSLFNSSERLAQTAARRVMTAGFKVDDFTDFTDILATNVSEYVKLGAIGYILVYSMEFDRQYGRI